VPVGGHAGGHHDGIGHRPVINPSIQEVASRNTYRNRSAARLRSRNAATSVSGPAQLRLTSDSEIPLSDPGPDQVVDLPRRGAIQEASMITANRD
jgi:hypothetical protein